VNNIRDRCICNQEGSHLGEELRRKYYLRMLLSFVEVVEEGPYNNKAVAFALVLLLDDAKEGNSFVGTF
jgi:hypothetical protein